MKEKRKKQALGFTIILSVILFSSLISFQFGLSTVPLAGPYYLDVPFGDASFYVGQFDSGDTYMVDCDTWQNTWSSSDSEAIINAALGNLTSGRTWQEKVFLKGNFSVDSTIIVPSYTILELDGNIYLESGSNCDLLRNENPATTDSWITIRGGVWNATRDLQTSGCGFNFTSTSPSDVLMYIHIEDLEIYEADEHALYMYRASHSKIERVHTEQTDENAFHLQIFSDSEVIGIRCPSTQGVGLYHAYGAANVFTDIYCGGSTQQPNGEGQIEIRTARNSQWNNIRIDSTQTGGLYLYGTASSGVINHVFNGLTITCLLNTTDNHDGIVLDGNVTKNLFNTIYVGWKQTAGAQYQWDYGITEVNGASNNTFVNGFVEEFKSAAWSLNASSHINDFLINDLLTENYGLAINASATTWSITHGLAGTPTFVSCSFNSTNWDSWKWTSTSTTITVTCVNRDVSDAIVACYWEAVYEP